MDNEPNPRRTRLNKIKNNILIMTGAELFQHGVEYLQLVALNTDLNQLLQFKVDQPEVYNAWAFSNAHGTSVGQGIQVACLLDLANVFTGIRFNKTSSVLLSAGVHFLAEIYAFHFLTDEIRVVDTTDILIATGVSFATLLVRGLIKSRNDAQNAFLSV